MKKTTMVILTMMVMMKGDAGFDECLADRQIDRSIDRSNKYIA